MSYKLLKNVYTGVVGAVKYYESGTPEEKIIPFTPDNTDYQEYLDWVAAGNTAEAAD